MFQPFYILNRFLVLNVTVGCLGAIANAVALYLFWLGGKQKKFQTFFFKTIQWLLVVHTGTIVIQLPLQLSK